MASGTINTQLYYVDDASARADITVGSEYAPNYSKITPPALPSGAKLVAITAYNWSSTTDAFWISPYLEAQAYIFAKTGTVIKGLRCRFWYVIQ